MLGRVGKYAVEMMWRNFVDLRATMLGRVRGAQLSAVKC
jgi:hypothetical protein